MGRAGLIGRFLLPCRCRIRNGGGEAGGNVEQLALVLPPSNRATSLEIACKLIQIRVLLSAQTSSLTLPQVGVRRGDGGAGASKCNSKRNDWNMGEWVRLASTNKVCVCACVYVCECVWECVCVCLLEKDHDIRGQGELEQGRLKIIIKTHGPDLPWSDVNIQMFPPPPIYLLYLSPCLHPSSPQVVR